jgi:hypothetical protein
MMMLNRKEIRHILEGLDVVRERMREDTSVDLGGDEYKELVRLQDRLIAALEALPY